MMQKSVAVGLAVGLGVALAACGGGGGGGVADTTPAVPQGASGSVGVVPGPAPATPAPVATPDPATVSPAAPAAHGDVQGYVAIGPVAGATVSAFALEGGKKGRLLASAKTDGTGRYRLNLADDSGAVLLESTGGSYRDPATGRDVALETSLRSVLDKVPAGAVAAERHLTPLTEAIVRNAAARSGGLSTDNVAGAREAAVARLGFDPFVLQPVRDGEPDCNLTCLHSVYMGVVAQEAGAPQSSLPVAFDDLARWLAAGTDEPSAALLQAAQDYGWSGVNETGLTNWTALRNASRYLTQTSIPSALAAVGHQVVTVGEFQFDIYNDEPKLRQYTLDLIIADLKATYPQMVAEFQPDGPRTVRIQIHAEPVPYVGLTGNGVMNLNGDYLVDAPDDIDFVTHEAFHLLQAYREDIGGFTEGMANYARYKYAFWRPRSPGAGLDLPQPNSTMWDGYGTMARFVRWIEIRKRVAIAEDLHRALRKGTYREQFWVDHVGLEMAQLWDEYRASPAFVPK